MLRLKKSKNIKYNPSLQPELIPLTQDTTSFGRSAEMADVAIDSSLSPRMISRVHAKISRKDDHFFIECDSLNGVLVNSVKRKKCELHDGDVVVFGGAGAKTSEGTLVNKTSQSELVYVFQSQQKCRQSKQDVEPKNAEKNKQKCYTAGEDSVQRTSPRRTATIGQCSKAMNNIQFKNTDTETFECSPGEGTSGGIVQQNEDVSANGADDIECTQAYKRCDDAPHSQDDKEGVVCKKRKKRSRMPFDSDEDR